MSRSFIFRFSLFLIALLAFPDFSFAGSLTVRGIKDPRITVESLSANYDAKRNFFCPAHRVTKFTEVEQTPEVYQAKMDFWSWSLEGFPCLRPHTLTSLDLRLSFIDLVTGDPRSLIVTFEPRPKVSEKDKEKNSSWSRTQAAFNCFYKVTNSLNEKAGFIEEDALFGCQVEEGAQNFQVNLGDFANTTFDLDLQIQLGALTEELLQSYTLPNSQTISLYGNSESQIGVTSRIVIDSADRSAEGLARALFEDGSYRAQVVRLDPISLLPIEVSFKIRINDQRAEQSLRLILNPTDGQFVSLKSGCQDIFAAGVNMILETKIVNKPSVCTPIELTRLLVESTEDPR